MTPAFTAFLISPASRLFQALNKGGNTISQNNITKGIAFKII
jgi:hypothetical protein